jgi:SPP1 family predicted phage head-tail adaptor
MEKHKYQIKDKRIKIFREHDQEIDGVLINYKIYEHPKNTTISAYVRQLSQNERNTARAVHDDSSIEFVINHRNIKPDMFIEFMDKTYQIGAPDQLEFYQTEIKFRAKEVTPKTYDQVIYKGWKT